MIVNLPTNLKPLFVLVKASTDNVIKGLLALNQGKRETIGNNGATNLARKIHKILLDAQGQKNITIIVEDGLDYDESQVEQEYQIAMEPLKMGTEFFTFDYMVKVLEL